jgi:hypothetical protein
MVKGRVMMDNIFYEGVPQGHEIFFKTAQTLGKKSLLTSPSFMIEFTVVV